MVSVLVLRDIKVTKTKLMITNTHTIRSEVKVVVIGGEGR